MTKGRKTKGRMTKGRMTKGRKTKVEKYRTPNDRTPNWTKRRKCPVFFHYNKFFKFLKSKTTKPILLDSLHITAAEYSESSNIGLVVCQ
jgi:hypothetical protein